MGETSKPYILRYITDSSRLALLLACQACETAIFANYMSTKRLCVLLLIALNDHKASGECSVGQTDPNIYCLFMFMYIQHA